jgi:mono/diheme cytochrome c family protein
MRKVVHWAGYTVAVVIGLLLAAAATVWLMASSRLNARPTPKVERLAMPTAAQLADGPRQLHVLGCLSCHGEGLRGDRFLDEPGTATIYTPNLTLLAALATDQQLAQAIRQGIGHDGKSLVVMPSQGYQFMRDSEVAAIISAIRALPRGGKEQPKRRIGRMGYLGLALGKLHTAPELVRTIRQNGAPDFGLKFAAGRRIVVVNCAECHGPQLKGQELEPGVVSPDMRIAGSYDLDQFRALLRTGVAPGNKDIGLMGRVAKRFKYLTDDEIAAIHAYLVERAQRMP